MFDLLIFDNDGTLVDSEFLCQVAMARELAARGHAADAEELSRAFRGWELARTLEVLGERYGTRFGDEFVSAYRARMMALLATELRPMPGAGDALDELATGPWARCVASGGPRPKIELALEITGLRHHFGDAIFSSYDIDRFKPEPDLFLHAAAALDVTPDRCLVIEDSAVGLEAARRARMTVVHVAPDAVDADGVFALRRLDALPELLAAL
ncbi:MAG: HAD-IA family hydrolase [Pseudomonadales bacterium]|nr:HAD-IA family hydrolase [Pseudomonadales bacterium]